MTAERLFSYWPNLLASEGLVCGMDISSAGMRYILCDLDGHVLSRGRLDRGLASADQALEELWQHLISQLHALHRSHDALVRVGVSFGGVVHPKSGKVLWSPGLPNWEGYELKLELEQLTAGAVVANNANAGVVGEVLFGAARGTRNAAYLHLGQGVGLGIFCDGRLYAGARGFAGELGHVRIVGSQSPCRCGGQGHLEAYAPPFLYRDTPLEREPGLKALDAALEMASRGISPYSQRLKLLTHSFVEALNKVWLLLDPEVIVVGSPSDNLNQYLVAQAMTSKDDWPFERAGSWRQLVASARPGESELLGALGLALLSLKGD